MLSYTHAHTYAHITHTRTYAHAHIHSRTYIHAIIDAHAHDRYRYTHMLDKLWVLLNPKVDF